MSSGGRGRRTWHAELAVAAGGQLALLAALSLAPGLGVVAWVVACGYAAVAFTVLGIALQRSGARGLGSANRVTLLRVVLAGGVMALVVDATEQHLVLAVLAAVAVGLDTVDGRIARRTGSASAFGARFDVEVDAFLVAVLSVHVASSLGAWVLVVGAMRYAFVVASWPLPWLRAPLPPRLTRKLAGALQGVVLVVATADVLPGPVTTGCVAAALAVLLCSFGRDAVLLAVTRVRTRGSDAASARRRPGRSCAASRSPRSGPYRSARR